MNGRKLIVLFVIATTGVVMDTWTDQSSGEGGASASERNVPIIRNISSPPASLCDTGGIASAFDCDLSRIGLGLSVQITGAETLGSPKSGFASIPNLSGLYGYLNNRSGHNENKNAPNGRTAAVLAWLKADNQGGGQGGSDPQFNSCFVTGALPGATSFTANPSCVLYLGQAVAGHDGVYLEGAEWSNDDNGRDVSMGGLVLRTKRTRAGGSGTCCADNTVFGLRVMTDPGTTVSGDAAIDVHGLWTFGIDLTGARVGSDAVVLAPAQRIAFNGRSGTWLPHRGNTYLEYNPATSSLQVDVNDHVVAALGSTFATMRPLDLNSSDTPSPPQSGWRLFSDRRDGKLKAIAPSGKITILASP